MVREDRVLRPTKKSEFVIVFANRAAEVGWRNLFATHRNALADAWDFLTKNPQLRTARNYALKDVASPIVRNGATMARWQYKPTVTGDARIWFYVDGQTVYLERVFTAHPNETK